MRSIDRKPSSMGIAELKPRQMVTDILTCLVCTVELCTESIAAVWVGAWRKGRRIGTWPRRGDGEKASWDVLNNAAWMERLDSRLGGRTGGFPSVLVLKFLARLFFLTI
jgi:hypothetical protein